MYNNTSLLICTQSYILQVQIFNREKSEPKNIRLIHFLWHVNVYLQLTTLVVMVSNPLWTCTIFLRPIRGVSLSKAVATPKPPRFLFCMDSIAHSMSHQALKAPTSHGVSALRRNAKLLYTSNVVIILNCNRLCQPDMHTGFTHKICISDQQI